MLQVITGIKKGEIPWAEGDGLNSLVVPSLCSLLGCGLLIFLILSRSSLSLRSQSVAS